VDRRAQGDLRDGARERIKAAGEEFGVSARHVAAAGSRRSGRGDGAGAEEEKSTFDVVLTGPGDKKIR
jgi:large subunit ribosomal protein L7/L12